MAILKKTLLGTVLAATALAGATPAMAQDRYRDRHHDNTAAVAVGAGVLGLAIGAIIASGNHHDDRYYNDGYVYRPNYAYRNGGWYGGYRYYNGWFYDRDGYRRYDRSDWDRIHRNWRAGYNGDRYQDRRDYRRYDYNRGYDHYRGHDGYRGRYHHEDDGD